MENLTINDVHPPPGIQQQQPQQHQQQQPPFQGAPQPQGPPPPPNMPPPVPQLPPQMFTTAAQLLDLTDKKLMVALRDGKKLIGVLRSWDQFGNLVLQNTIERIYAGGHYADIPRGIFLVRGENVLLLGEIDLDRDDDPPPGLVEAPADRVHALQRQETERRKRADKRRLTRLQRYGFEGVEGLETL